MGRDNDPTGYESPAHKVTVKPFFMDTYEVTNEDFAKFLADTHNMYSTQIQYSRIVSHDTARQPVTGVTWNMAKAYADWAGKRLPTEEEWEFAARGTDGRRYPWGSDWKSGLANVGKTVPPNSTGYTGLTNVGSYQDASPYGLHDMVGNAWEWTASDLKAYPGGHLPVDAKTSDKVIRGGSWASTPETATTTYRRGWGANNEKDYSYTGFRCVKDIGK